MIGKINQVSHLKGKKTVLGNILSWRPIIHLIEVYQKRVMINSNALNKKFKFALNYFKLQVPIIAEIK